VADTFGNDNEPYCSNCGYLLSGATESSKCPECGRPLVEVLTRAPRQNETGRRYRSRARVLGMPAIDIAFGPKGGELRGKARGFVALGDDAVGVLAIGGSARGVVAIGGGAMGVCSMGGGSLGLLTAVGGGVLSGGVAAGGGAIGGVLGMGGGAAGFIAQGGGALGVFARGGSAFGKFVISAGGRADPEALNLFQSLGWFTGPWPPWGFLSAALPLMYVSAVTLGLAVLCAAIAWAACRAAPGPETT
jgi:predicted RNA-binding Zn-ribbon protein involved in translation (DUF1610 family)